jgi:Asp-tRNA(Asn)/Glu-tRNA(Gln) amidotransferase B subunit
MAYQMTITLSDQEYAALAAEAVKSGKQPERLLQEIMKEHLQSLSPEKRPMTVRELAEKQYREGKLLSLVTRRLLTPEEQAEREQLAQLFASGKSASEMIIEDRGPY